jgi:hypothetical protein
MLEGLRRAIISQEGEKGSVHMAKVRDSTWILNIYDQVSHDSVVHYIWNMK